MWTSARLSTAFGVLTALLMTLHGGARVSGQDWAEKMFETKSHDFRTVGRGAKAEFRFEFRNLYEEEVHVSALRTSCGCTSPSLTQETLQTYETGAVVAKFNTDSFVGRKSAVITVVFDKPYYAEVQLRVTGYIRTDISFEPSEVAFGELAPGESREEVVVITHRGNSDWKISDVRSHCDHLQVQLEDAEKQPAVGASPSSVKYKMRVKVKDSMPEGDFQERLTLVSNDGRFPTTNLSVSGRVRPALSVSPAALSLGTIESGGVAEKRVVVRGEEPFSIKNVVCSDERYEFDVPEGSKKIHFLKLRFRAETEEPISHRVRVESDLPSSKSASFIVTGRIADHQ